MAPLRATPPSTSWIALREQILDNTAFLFAPGSPDAKTNILSSVDEKGLWHARVICSMRGKRQERLWASGRTACEAMHALHIRTSQAVHHYLALHGAGFPRDYDSDDVSDADDDLDAEDLDDDLDDVSVWNDGAPDESDGEEAVPAVPVPDLNPNTPRRQADGRQSGNVRLPVQTLFRGNNSNGVAQRGAAAVSCGNGIVACAQTGWTPAESQRQPLLATATAPKKSQAATQVAAKPTVWARATDAAEAPCPGPAASDKSARQPFIDKRRTTPARTAAPNPPPAQLAAGRRRSHPVQAPAACHHVRLIISLTLSGIPSERCPVYQTITTIARPSLRALLGAAVGHVRSIPTPSTTAERETPTLRARVKRAQMGELMWDMGGYRADDMSMFFLSGQEADDAAMPLFEIDVEEAVGLPVLTPW